MAGKTTTDYLLEWSPRLLEAERAVPGQLAASAMLLAEHWKRTWEVEMLNRGKYE